MITRASFRNFKSLREVDVTFASPLTVLVGPNGSGKTSILEGIHAMSQVAQAAAGNKQPDPRYLLRYLARGTDPRTFRLSVDERSPTGGTQTVTASGEGGEYVDGHFRLGFHVEAPPPTGGPCPPAPPSDSFPRLRTTSLLRLDAGRLAAPSRAESFPPVLEPDGANLPSVLSYLGSYHPEAFRDIVEGVRALIPAVAGVRAVYDQPADQDRLVFDFAAAPEVPASLASTGTLLALGILAALHHPSRPGVVLCDDIDSGLHPRAQMALVDGLRTILDRKPLLQIIATSHSPYILSRLEWEEVRVTSLRDDGSAVCVPLTAHPDVDRWREAMTPGEFWSHLGDEWVRKLDRRQATPAAAP